MMSSIFRFYRAAQYAKLTRRQASLRILSHFPKLTTSVFEEGERGGIFIRGTDVEATAKDRQFLLAGSDLLKKLIEETKASFRAHPDGVLLEVGGVKLLLQHWEELFIAEEVFTNGVYNLRMNQPFVLIDVGMNVGTTSLFFASKKACQAVYSFELFPPTVEKAQRNLSLNPDIARKISITPKGLAARSSSSEMDYVDEFKGSIGIWGMPDYAVAKNGKIRKVPVEFISCQEAIPGILQKHGEQTIICKLDCEGAEYEILESLGEMGLLRNVSVFMIEWHRKGAAAIESVLQKHGFSVLSFSPNAPTHGMIYAWRQAEASNGSRANLL